MRFILPEHRYIEPGTTRTVTKFLWLPIIIRDEIRWLEVATYREVRKREE